MLGGYSSEDYRAFRLWAESLDGVQVQLDNVPADLHGSLLFRSLVISDSFRAAACIYLWVSFCRMSLSDCVVMESCKVRCCMLSVQLQMLWARASRPKGWFL